jgi:hypothetical protein
VKLVKDAFNLLFTVSDLLILNQVQFLQLKKTFKYYSDVFLDNLCEDWLTIHHFRDDLDESTERLACRELWHETILTKCLLLLL